MMNSAAGGVMVVKKPRDNRGRGGGSEREDRTAREMLEYCIVLVKNLSPDSLPSPSVAILGFINRLKFVIIMYTI